ncbi:MAG: sulfite exporter TauE/SafE [Myxococcota bacterium]|jgi:sulfite exporter TauE/SafE
MITALVATFTASLAGSMHCVGMCGGLVAAYSGDQRSRSQAHVAYHGVRGVAYLLLGTLAGTIGATLDLTSVANGLGPIAMVLAGTTMVVMGLMALGRLVGLKLPHLRPPLALGRFLSRLARFSQRRGVVGRAAILGLSSALLPCGWLWAFVLAAGGTGSPIGGAMMMFAFWLGTVPALLGLGLGLRVAAGRLGHSVSAVAAIAVVLVGLWTIQSRAAFAIGLPAVSEDTQPLAPSEITPTCCHDE